MAKKTKSKTKKKPSYAAVVGLVGSGSVPIKSAKANLSDFIEAQDGEILWVLPHTADNSKSIEKVMEFIWNEDAKFALVSDGTDDDEEWEENAQSTVVVPDDADVYANLVTEVAGYKAENLIVMVILDEENSDDLDLIDAAASEGLTTLDLASGLSEIEIETVEEEPEEAEDDDDTSDEDESDAGVHTEPLFSDKVQKLIDKGNFSKAGEKMADELGNDGVKKLAEEFGLDVKKGAWAKTVGAAIAEHLGSAAGDGDEIEEAEEVEEKPAKKPKDKKSKPSKKAEEVEEETVKDEDVDSEVVTEAASNGEPEWYAKVRTLELLAGVASAQGVPAAKEFYTFAKAKGLIE